MAICHLALLANVSVVRNVEESLGKNSRLAVSVSILAHDLILKCLNQDVKIATSESH